MKFQFTPVRLAYTLVLFALVNTAVSCAPSTPEAEMPGIVENEGRYALLVDGEPFFMFGGQSANSSTWPKMLPGVWSTIESMHANTLEIPIYWEQFEPEPGKFDYSMIQMVLDQARERDVRLVLLWFATWKNGSNHYMPQWMKNDPQKYPNLMNKEGRYVDSPSPHATASMEADAKAFTEFMAYLKKADPQHTVIMVQVQNEPGSWYSVRDYSPAAQQLFEQPVPEALLQAHVLEQLNIPAGARGTWAEVFGKDADEYFHAWHVASYIEYVAAAGKAVNPLPMYVNVALRDPLTNPPATQYESGGATDNVIPIWKAAAPSIDLLAPDIYLRGDKTVLKVIELYNRPDNALMVPETGGNVKYLYKVIENGIGYAPFGIDGRRGAAAASDRPDPLSQEYKLLAPMAGKLAQWSFEGRIQSVVEPDEGEQVQRINLGEWEAVIMFGRGRRLDLLQDQQPQNRTGKAMIIKLDENEFLAVGTTCRFTFKPIGKNEGKNWQYLKVMEGYYENGEFQMIRILNGDQTDWGGPYVGEIPTLLHFSLGVRE
ncbi:MAG: DUF5597 domain-containing protein [Bacteroidales bacterium]|nr:DUF5597 domain-containing protein [Bacteroidales bacterium]MDD3522013.1 DUF5597 domain-containing protein [Bacteroidales bacterium]MDD4031003.1 DUF5597 domain-containing protein [Bacteroidales bacterium]MDD4435784.1 DUF5597 domain-containing protein [Bacteroidales bacterium]